VGLSTFAYSSLSVCAPSRSPTPYPGSSPRTHRGGGSGSALSSGEIAAIVGSVTGFFIIAGSVAAYVYFFSEKAKMRRQREKRLQQLPVHSALLSRPSRRRINDEELVMLIRENIHTVKEVDFDGRKAVDIVLLGLASMKVPLEATVALLEASLPPIVGGRDSLDDKSELRTLRSIICEAPMSRLGSGEEVGEVKGDEEEAKRQSRKSDSPGGKLVRSSVWENAVQHDSMEVAEAVDCVLERHKGHVHILANLTDKKGRALKDIAQPLCKAAMLRRLNLHQRYELRIGPPLHKSATSLVVHAKDHEDHLFSPDHNGIDCFKEVVLKFMKFKDQFNREMQTRAKGEFDEKFVLPVMRGYDDESSEEDDVRFFDDAVAKGFVEYPYCIVMEAAACSLKHAIDQQLIAAKDWEQIRQMARQLVTCLQHIHEKGFIHGDLKRKFSAVIRLTCCTLTLSLY